MPDSLLMTDTCLVALAKSGDSLLDDSETKLREFLRPWYGVEEYTAEILACLLQSSSHADSPPLKLKEKRLYELHEHLKRPKAWMIWW